MSTAVRASQRLLFLALCINLLSACDTTDSSALVADAKAKLAAGDYQAALIQLKNAAAQDEKNAEARFELGKLYLIQQDLAGAEKEFRRAREAGYPENAVNPLIARALLSQREYQRVLDELPAPAETTPETATLQALRATAILGLGRKDDAREELQRALKRAPDNAEVHLALAQLALAEGDSDKAMRDLDQALLIDPKHRDSLMLKGDLLRGAGKPAEAAGIYREILRIDPRNSSTRLALAGLAISENKLDEARKEVDAALKLTPNSVQARYTQALIEFRDNKVERARDLLAPVLKVAPDYVPALLLGGSIEFALGNLQTAEAHLNKVVKASPRHAYALRLLSAAQLRQGRVDDAARTLTPILQTQTPDAGLLVIAGEIAQARKEYAKAVALFEQAAKLNPDSATIRTELGISRLAQGDSRAMSDLQAAAGMEQAGGRADAIIILSQLQKKQFDAALASIAALEKKQPATPITWQYRGAAQLGKGDTTRARESFEQALKLDPAFFPAAASLAQLDLRDKQPAAARQRLEGVLKADPKHLQAMLALADLALRSGDTPRYVGWLEKAAAAHPQALPPRMALASHLLATGDKGKALAAARDAVNAQPDNPAALELLASVQLSMGDVTNALGSYRKLVERQPGQVAPLVRLASAQIVAKDLAAARKTLQDALRIQPDSLDAQLKLGSVEIQSGRYDEALKLARQLQQQKPSHPAGPTLEGEAAFSRKDHPAALAAFERAHKLAPAGALLARQLQALTAMQRPEEGEKRLAAWVGAHPQDAGARAVLAESLITRKQYAAAAEHYLALNRSTPGSLLVLNNLAWALHESGDKRAVSFAEQALRLQPENPMVMDTYGWILISQGQAAKALPHLRKALSKAPDNPEIQYHLAVALFRTGDRARAQSELERLLASGSRFPQEQDARTLLAQLQNKTR